MSEALTKPEYGQTDIQKGGLGFGKSRFFELKPDYIALTQNMIGNWNAASGPRPTPGKLRTGAGQEFDKMKVVMLFEPVDWANYYLEDSKTFSSENLLCFSRNLQLAKGKIVGGTPHPQARQPQAMACAGCSKGSWTKYNQTANRKDIPPCKAFVHTLVVDRLTKFAYTLDVKSTSLDRKLKDGFWNAMQNLARQMSLLQLEGKNPNIFDFSFDIYSVPQQNGQYYTLGFNKPSLIPEEDRAQFGELFLEFINRFSQGESIEDLAAKAEAQVASETAKVEAQIIDQPSSTTGPVVDGDYVTI